MSFPTKFTAQQMREITPEELSRIFLKEFQIRSRMTPAELMSRTMYHSNGFSGIVAMLVDDHNDFGMQPYQWNELRSQFDGKVAQAKQLLFSGNLVYPDPSQGSPEYVKLTQAGLEANVDAPIFAVTDTDEFIRFVRGSGSALDSVVEGYLRESYRAAQGNLWLSATFMLGAASERLLFLTAEHIDTLLKNPAETAKLAKLWKAREVKEWIVGHLGGLRKAYPSSSGAFTDVEDTFNTLFTLYRYQRNETGHPRDSMPSVNPAQIKPMLLGFGTFQERVNAILDVKP